VCQILEVRDEWSTFKCRKVVILGIWKLSGNPNERASGQSYPLRLVQTKHILWIFVKIPRMYSNMFEYTRIYLNMLEYTRICSNMLKIYSNMLEYIQIISLSSGREGLLSITGGWADVRTTLQRRLIVKEGTKNSHYTSNSWGIFSEFIFVLDKKPTVDMKVLVYFNFSKIKIWKKMESLSSMRNGRFHLSKCRGKVQKMGMLYTHSPKMPIHLQTSS
jgi:hypothetical protein